MPTALENVFYNNTTIKTDVGCTVEYNMNSMIDGITVTSATADTTYSSGITDWPDGKANPFKKLFPVDSIVRSFRPIYPGAKYFIMAEPDNTYLPFRTISYTGEGKNSSVTGAKPRIYYPGITTSYKYWLSAKNANVDLTVQYLQTTETWTAAGKTGSIPAGNKAALANKIIVSFEKFHALPTQYRLTITPVTGLPMTTTYAAPPSSGVVTHYYNGTNWSTTSISEPYTFNEPQLIKSIRLEATNPGSGKYIGVIEISPRWIKDISADIVSLDLNKETSSSSEDLIPVGTVTENSLNLNLTRYDQTILPMIQYNREDAWTASPTIQSAVYFVKNAELKPYFKIYHTAGALGTSPNKYDKSYQGTYYMDNWSIEEYGESTINAIDGAKTLMETLCPDLLCEDFPVTAILRNLLDSVGFTNYNFNLATTETSIPQVRYWWTNDTTTIWEAIQELCRDIQMNAFFDNDNVLQFYSRDYIYSTSRTASWNFYYDGEGSALPNIINFSKKEIASANMVKVLWQSPLVSNYTGTSGSLWKAPTSFLSAGALKTALAIDGDEFVIEIIVTDEYSRQQSFYNFNGYILVDAEIIEFDAIGYDFTPLDGGAKQHIWITSQSDVSKYRSLAKAGYEDVNKPAETAYFKPSGRYRIKRESYPDGTLIGRGALGTVAAAHDPATSKLEGWTGRVVTQS